MLNVFTTEKSRGSGVVTRKLWEVLDMAVTLC